MADVLYINGRFTTTDERVLGVEDRGFQFGDAVYEVLKFTNRRPLFFSDHFRRFQAGLSYLEIPFSLSAPDLHSVCAELLERTQFASGLLYLQVSRGESERSHFYPENVQPTFVLYSRRFNFPDVAKKERGIRVITTADQRSRLCDVKSVNLLPNLVAKKKAQRAGAEEAILVDGGEVREGASSSFFAVVDGRLVTHPSASCILPGTVRDLVLSLALTEKIPIEERPIRDYELLTLTEAFITSTSQGVMPVTEIDGRIVRNSRIGPVTEVLQRAFDELEEKESQVGNLRQIPENGSR
ncbi:MAG TPA: aminotransferase class IV [Thermoanaerobaculia bacterium]|nr:aminotransferase class IV [Thermoanaerobaculia bacterium]